MAYVSSDEENLNINHTRKRRRLNPHIDSSSDDGVVASSPQSATLEHKGETPPPEPQERQKPRHRIHIVKNDNIPEDEFFTQIPSSSQDPYRIRGGYWQKARPISPPQPPLPPVPLFEERPRSKAQGMTSPDRFPERHSSYDSAGQAPPDPEPQSPLPEPDSGQMRDAEDTFLLGELDDLSDHFPSPTSGVPHTMPLPIEISSQQDYRCEWSSQIQQPVRLAAPHSNLRQTTLFGSQIRGDASTAQSTQSKRVHNYPMANSEEPPTHHKLDEDALQSWVYPTNLGTIRDYQFNIVSRGLYHNLLVALPTGLGKTFIAATIMLNWFRWTKDAQMVFVAPTKPLVAQQVDACFHIAGIPRSATTLLTGNISPALRAEEWASKRVFFMTPQTLINDLKGGAADPKRIVLIVVDEAHRATGNYAYVEVVSFLRRFNNSFRILALTATPGSSVESVQGVIDGLGIARTEIRTEESLDIRQYVHQRNVDTMVFEYNDETELLMDLLSKAIRPVLGILNSKNAYWSKDPMALSAYGCTIARQNWMKSPAGRTASMGEKGQVNSIFNVLATLAHAIELLKFHGISPFYHKLVAFRDEVPEGKKSSKYRKQIVDNADFKKMMSTIQTWINNPGFIGHPKLEYLSQVALNHFIDAGEGRDAGPQISPAATRIMVFAHYRDSAEEIMRVLNRHSPMVRAHVFVGQAASRGSDGMDQKKQQEIIDKFKQGTYNTLVATSIGEEGLDIGEVDLIICYDASASPIRMLQRMGRTGRKRAGNIVVLLMKQKEQKNFEQAKDNYEKMQSMIAEGTRFKYHHDLSPRIVPRAVNPIVDKRYVEIPIENSQPDLPEPKKKKGRAPKKPPKKFHMPDGVITGFTTAADLGRGESKPSKLRARYQAASPVPEPLPDIKDVLLSTNQEEELERTYLNIGGDEAQIVEYPRLDRYPHLQRLERRTKLIGHGIATWRTIHMLNAMHDMDDDALDIFERNLHAEDRDQADAAVKGELVVHFSPAEAARPPIELPATRKLGRKKPKAPKSKNASRQRPVQRSSSALEDGIDLMNTDDEHEYDEDDHDSDLMDFIDDATPAKASSLPSSPPPTAMSSKSIPLTGDGRNGEDRQSDRDEEELSEMESLLRPARPSGVVKRGSRRVVCDNSDDEEGL